MSTKTRKGSDDDERKLASDHGRAKTRSGEEPKSNKTRGGRNTKAPGKRP